MAGCSSSTKKSISYRASAVNTEKSIVVLVPGITGTAMAHRDTGDIAWGTAKRLFAPRDGGYALALPIGIEPGDPTTLEPAYVLDEIRIGPLHKPVYGPLLEHLEDRGWTRGHADDPQPEDNLFPYPYDWRRDNTESVAHLSAWLRELATSRGHASSRPLPVSLICQSNGAHVCRWLAKYGAATLEQAETGAAPGPPAEIDIRRIVLVGTANGGALRNLREMDRGRGYVPLGLGRKWQPEVVFTFPSVFQDLAGYREDGDWFLDESGRDPDVELYDAETWIEHRWSVFDPETRERISKNDDAGIFGTDADRRAHLVRQLGRAQRFRRLLRQDPPGYVSPALHSIQNGYEPTADRAVIVPDEDDPNGTDLWFTEDRKLHGHKALDALAGVPGDGHAALESQLDLSPAELEALHPPLYVTGTHFTLLHHPATAPAVAEALR